MENKRVLTKDDWLRAAMEALRAQGVGGVRVLTLARSLDVTRGSFYWHFRNRADLLDHMLDWWDREMTDVVVRYTERLEGAGQKRIPALAELILRRDLSRYDLAIWSWAQGDRKVATVVRRIMRKRLEYVSKLFRDAGFSPGEATTRGNLLAIYIMSEKTVHVGESLQARLRRLHRQIRWLTRKD